MARPKGSRNKAKYVPSGRRPETFIDGRPAPRGVLADALAAALKPGEKPDDLTVLATDHDPFRMDMPRKMEAAYWLRDRWREVDAKRGDQEKRHGRRIHYRVLTKLMPNGNPYISIEECWLWLMNEAIKGARWLGLIPADRIIDKRNGKPQLLTATAPDPSDGYRLGAAYFNADDMRPEAVLDGFTEWQAYHIALVAEKSSTADVLAPLATEVDADLYTPQGEMTDTLCYEMARDAVAEGRPLVVIGFDDGDPSGWQMMISVGRKLQALKILYFPELEYRVVRGALTPEQIRSFDPPLESSPLSANELRANDWTEATGLLQTELEALEDVPGELERLARAAIAPWRDPTLWRRVRQARLEWEREAQAELDEVMDADEELADLRQAALDAVAAVADRVRENIRENIREVDWPEVPEVPVPVLQPKGPTLISSDDDLRTGSLKLIASKAYRTYED